MKHLKRFTLIGAFIVLITGFLAHFLYDWTGRNPVVGLFTPVNESVWEHMKLLFFPMLFYYLTVISPRSENRPCLTSAFCFGILAGTFLIPLCYYAYTAIFNKDILFWDIGIFIFSTLSAFWLSYRLSLSCRLKSHALLLAFLVCILFVCFIVFTRRPPALKIFDDPTVSSYILFPFSVLQAFRLSLL